MSSPFGHANSSLSTIKHLDLGGTRVTSAGTPHLRHLDLKWLSLDKAKITDRDFVHLRHMQHLECLRCDETCIGDEGLGEVCRPISSFWLSLRMDSISEAGLEQLSALPRLQHVHAEGTPIGRTAVEKLHELYPQLYISIEVRHLRRFFHPLNRPLRRFKAGIALFYRPSLDSLRAGA